MLFQSSQAMSRSTEKKRREKSVSWRRWCSAPTEGSLLVVYWKVVSWVNYAVKRRATLAMTGDFISVTW